MYFEGGDEYDDYDDFGLNSGGGGGGGGGNKNTKKATARVEKQQQDRGGARGSGTIYSNKHTRLREAAMHNKGKR